jgi:hypothetical protein
MKFSCSFTRYVGTAPSGGKTLGSDVLPTDSNSNPIKVSPQGGYDNALSSRIVSINGWPLSRIAFAGKYTGAGPAVAGPVALYVFEDNLQCWIPLACSAGTSPTYTCGTNAAPSAPIFFDAMSLIDLPHVQSDLGAVNPGTAMFLAIVGGGTSPPNGTYQFIVGAEMTANPF